MGLHFSLVVDSGITGMSRASETEMQWFRETACTVVVITMVQK